MGIGERGDQRDFLVANRHPASAKLLNNTTHMYRIPHQDRITQETQTTRLVHHLLIVSGLKRALIRKKEPASQLMPELPPVQLALDLMAEVHVLDIAQDMEGLKHA